MNSTRIVCRVWAPGCHRLATTTRRRRHSTPTAHDRPLIPVCQNCEIHL